MKKLLFFIALVSTLTHGADNKIYVDQAGDTLSSTLKQDGGGNTIGTSTTDFTIKGDTMTFNVEQIGSTNTLDGHVVGDDSDTVISVTGSSNDIDLNCATATTTAGAGKCEDVDTNITVDGSSNDMVIDIGQNTDASGLNLDINVTGGSNTIDMDLDSSDDKELYDESYTGIPLNDFDMFT